MGAMARDLAKQTSGMLVLMIGRVKKVGLARASGTLEKVGLMRSVARRVARRVARNLARKALRVGRESIVETEKTGAKVPQKQLLLDEFLIEAVEKRKLLLLLLLLSLS